MKLNINQAGIYSGVIAAVMITEDQSVALHTNAQTVVDCCTVDTPNCTSLILCQYWWHQSDFVSKLKRLPCIHSNAASKDKWLVHIGHSYGCHMCKQKLREGRYGNGIWNWKIKVLWLLLVKPIHYGMALLWRV